MFHQLCEVWNVAHQDQVFIDNIFQTLPPNQQVHSFLIAGWAVGNKIFDGDQTVDKLIEIVVKAGKIVLKSLIFSSHNSNY